MKFKIATNFIWRVGRGVHHRDSTLPPYGWSSHEVNSQRHFVVRDMTSRASRCKARRQSPSLVPSSKHDPICAMSVQCVLPIPFALRISWTNVAPGRASTDHSFPCQFSQSLLCFPLYPRTNTNSLCSLPALSKPATSNMSEAICAPPALSRLATSNKLDPFAPCLLSQSGQCDCLVQWNKLYCSP